MDIKAFLDRYSDYRDGGMTPEEVVEFEKEIAGCSSFSRYHAVMDEGISLLTSLPEAESADDFMPRLRHRLYNVDQGIAITSRWRGGSAALLGMAGVGILALFWLPFAATVPLELELPPVAAQAPSGAATAAVPALFRQGPFLDTVDPATAGVLGSQSDGVNQEWRSHTTVYSAQLTKAQGERSNR